MGKNSVTPWMIAMTKICKNDNTAVLVLSRGRPAAPIHRGTRLAFSNQGYCGRNGPVSALKYFFGLFCDFFRNN
jgi:hypothetical protein